MSQAIGCSVTTVRPTKASALRRAYQPTLAYGRGSELSVGRCLRLLVGNTALDADPISISSLLRVRRTEAA